MSATDLQYRERPGRHLAVAAVWSSHAATPGATLVAADGCFDLIVCASNQGGVSAFVSTPVALAHQVTIESDDRHVGVRLRPGFGPALVGRPALLRAAEVLTVERADDLEALVVNAVEALAKQPNIVADFIEKARASSGVVRLTGNASASRERELQRACRKWIGLSPKAFLRIERAWAARDAIAEGRALAAIAADLGYADQAHLTRELRGLLGVKPRQLRLVGNLQDPATLIRYPIENKPSPMETA
jgi:AraC-like DNA-binding protein